MLVLMVCTGNICRSPMAEVLLRHRLQRRGCRDVEVVSAGTWAREGNAATPEAVQALASAGVDVSTHRARSLTAHMVHAADLVVGMTSVHRREVVELVPDAGNKIVLMKELAEMAAGGPPPRLQELLAARRPAWRRELDLDDPYGLGPAAYRRALRDVERGVAVLVEALCPKRP